MALPKIISLAGACLVFLQGSHASGSQPASPEHSAVNCLTAMNNARGAAGLAYFTQGVDEATLEGLAKKEGIDDPWSAVCQGIHEGEPGYHEKTTYFFAPQTGAAADCPAAVAYWQSGLTKFSGSLPPAYTNTTSIYSDPSFFGLVGLYNPKASPTVDCQFVKCPASSVTSTSTATTSTGTSGGQPEGEAAAARRRLEATASTYNALLCMTTPPALVTGEQPFEQDQWNKIVGSISAASSATVSAFPLIALAALSIALF